MMYCYSCHGVRTENEMEDAGYAEFNPDSGRFHRFIACPCGEREDFTEAYQCDDCEEWYPICDFAPGTDFCFPCAKKEENQ